ncbi:MAG: aldo/keto reductase, partial [Microbacterium sp.]|nr:aldo/keto reductase [Microbacterium sp.]
MGENVRVALGETGLRVFPLMLGGAEFVWNVDLESSH